MEKSETKTFGSIVLILSLSGLFRFASKQVIFLFVQQTNFTDRMASMAAMLILTGILFGLSKKKRTRLSVFPERFTWPYIGATVLFTVLLIASPSNYRGGMESVFLLAYSCIVTPIFEEVLFRGYIWNKLNGIWENKWATYLTTSILFGLWHLAYIDSIAFRVEDGLLSVMVWKVVTGLCFGIVLGAVRMKTKNCYTAILLHGVMNLFGR
ncbi:MAG: lysostaphin resistance A-like protein [Fusicatenibacter sp.]